MNVKELLVKHEGVRLKPYRCPAGKLTIGVGRNIEDNGITEAEAMFLLANDIRRVELELEPFAWYNGLDDVRKAALVDMCFNLGLPRLLKFRKMIAALARRDYGEAAMEMLDSAWARQVGARAVRLSNMVKTGEYPKDL